MAKMHQWRKIGTAHQVCVVCDATRWGKPGGWGRAMKNGRSIKHCPTTKS